MLDIWIDQLSGLGMNLTLATILVRLLAVLAVGGLSWASYLIARNFLVRAITQVVSHTKTKWDDVLQEFHFFRKLANLAPALVIFYAAPVVLTWTPKLLSLTRNLSMIYMILAGLLCINAFLHALLQIYQGYAISRELHIKGFVQVVQIALFFISGILIIAIVLDKNPLYLISGLGAMTAVLMLIFKDALLGLAAGVQLIGNRMVAQGDWIEMPAFGADGDVVDVGLTTVKVRNFDKTITSIPTYTLISSSFKNWRGMTESGGRRIKRAVHIDMASIRFCDEKMLERFRSIRYISSYMESKLSEISEYNHAFAPDDPIPANRRQLTNIGTFRAYLEAYLRQHPMIDTSMTFLVRQLAPTPHGLPIEIYVFCKSTVWSVYEGVQADIFDHILAIAPLFDLNIFQAPSGADITACMGNRLPRHP